MSKLAYLKAQRGQAGVPILAGLAAIAPKALGFLGKTVGKIFGSKAGKVAAGAIAGGAGWNIGGKLVGGGKQAAPVMFGARRKGRGITATELRGFNKVASLLHRVGMVPRKTRGYKKCH